VRIISGKYRAKQIIAPSNLPVRPTTDFAKSALFNILNLHFNFSSVRFLDLFCGTGNISFEMISRGCEHIVAVDANSQCLNFVRRIAEQELKCTIKTTRYDALRFIKSCKEKYDIIFADPPYKYESREELINSIFSYELLEKGGVFVLEHPSGDHYDGIKEFVEKRSYGAVQFSFFKNSIEK